VLRPSQPYESALATIIASHHTVIDDEAFEDAIDKMNAYQKRAGHDLELKELAARVESLSDVEFQRLVALGSAENAAL
jgi:hypothetical protein